METTREMGGDRSEVLITLSLALAHFSLSLSLYSPNINALEPFRLDSYSKSSGFNGTWVLVG
jgi:hypothetical protein